MGFHGFGALGKFLPRPARSVVETGGHSPSLCHTPIVCRLGAPDTDVSLSNHCASALFLTIGRIVVKAFYLL